MKAILLKVLKVSCIIFGSILILMFFLPMLFPNFVAAKIKTWANGAITSKLNFSKARLSFFNHFPSLTLTLYDVALNGSPPFQKDTLLTADEVALGIDLTTVFSERIRINEIFLSDGSIDIEVNEKGEANYNVYKSDTTKASAANDTSSTQLKIEKIQIDNTYIVYNDLSLPMRIEASELNYIGKGDLSQAIFDLTSHIEAKYFDLDYDNKHYLGSKTINADLITKINTNSLAFRFEKNDLLINSLPIDVKGIFEFLANGYNMDFRLISKKSDLHDIFTALPPRIVNWLDSTEVKGDADIEAYLAGKYITETNTMPNLGLNIQIRNGFVSNKNAPAPVKNLFLNFDTKLPSLNTDSLYVNIDSIYFNIDKDYFSAIVNLQGMDEPVIKAKINSDIDLEKWDRALGIPGFDIKGRFTIHLLADGKYATAVAEKGLRKVKDTIISSIPKFDFQSTLTGGYFKFADLPQPVTNISFKLDARCPDSNYRHTNISMENINANVLNNFIKGFFKISSAEDFPIEARLQSVFHLSEIKQFYPLDSADVAGDLNIDINTKGKYNPSKKLFPVTLALLKMNNGSIQTKYYPQPIQKIVVDATVTNSNGNMKDLSVDLKPIAFEFEGQPFILKVSLINFENIKYEVTSKGTIDVGKIYRVFAINGYNAKGFIQTDLSLKGLQSDAKAGRFERLQNKGTLKVRNIVLTSELFPMPLYVSSGTFRFNQDKMLFDEFKASYGKTNLTLKGYLNNVINYALKDDASLEGSFDLSTAYVDVNELMFFGDTKDNTSSSSKDAASATGVIMVPKNLSFTFNAAANKVSYNDIDLKDFKGQVVIDGGKIKLNETGFSIIDAPVEMNATYGSLSPRKAYFDYHINAKEFDVQKAYKQIKIFHDLAPAAANAQGIISLDYTLSGKLNDTMYPIYPSLKGGGVLSVKNVKMKGFKLMNAVSQSTGKDDIKDPDLSKVNIKTSIANNIITLQRTKLRVAGFRPRFEGQVSFDGKLNLSGRLGLPPFGIIGIPFTVTGTQEDPKVKLRHAKESDKIEETTEEPDTDE